MITDSYLNKVVNETIKRFLKENIEEPQNDFYAIGFAEQYYTLWYVEHQERQIDQGRTEKRTKYNYIKNISKDENTAKSKYPEAVYLPELRGKSRTWTTQPRIEWTCVDRFRFGKYAGQEIDKVGDIGYTKWYCEQITDEEHKKYVLEYLESKGYVYLDHQFVTREEAERRKQEQAEKSERLRELRSAAENGDTVDIFITRNPDGHGEIYDEERDVNFYFDNVVEREYKGYPYYLPAINGKGKIVKNKTIRAKIEERTSDGWTMFESYFTSEAYRVWATKGMELIPFYGHEDEEEPIWESLESLIPKCKKFAEENDVTSLAIKDMSGNTVCEYNKNKKGTEFHITDFVVLKA